MQEFRSSIWAVGLGATLFIAVGLSGCKARPPLITDDIAMTSNVAREGQICSPEGQVAECHSLEPTDNVCLNGIHECRNGRWGPCENLTQRVLTSETGGVGTMRSPVLGLPIVCSGCDSTCFTTTDTLDQNDLDTSTSITNDGCVESTTGGIQISTSAVKATGNYAWIANTQISTVSKVHLTNQTVDGVYRVGLKTQQPAASTGGNWDWDSSSQGNFPSRTAVDGEGYAYVAQRAFAGLASVTKIAGDISQCIDLDGSSDIQTSSGLGDILGWPGYVGQDECIIWNKVVGNIDDWARALTIDPYGRIWVGLHNAARYEVLDRADGGLLGSVNVHNCPYGAVMASDGKLWSIHRNDCGGVPWNGGEIQVIDTNDLDPNNIIAGKVYDTPSDGYGITVDGNGTVYTSSWSGNVHRFDPVAETWISAVTNGSSTGIAAVDGGKIYVANRGNDTISEHDPLTMALERTFDISAFGTEPWGVCPDFNGRIWTANQSSPDAVVIDPAAPVGSEIVASIPVEDTSYTYSDFTGYSYASFVALSASFSRRYDATDLMCLVGFSALRNRIHWEADIPPGAALVFYAQAADAPNAASADAALDAATKVLLGTTTEATGQLDIDSTMSLAGENGSLRFIRIQIVLRRGTDSPVVHKLILEEYCQ